MHGAKLLYAYCEATVPKITVITRKAYGGAYCVMSSKHIRGDANFAWPTAEIAVMGPDGAVNIVYRRELEKAREEGGDAAFTKMRTEKIEEFRDRFANPFVAAQLGYLDSVIRPRDTRKKIIQALEMLDTKRDNNPPKKLLKYSLRYKSPRRDHGSSGRYRRPDFQGGSAATQQSPAGLQR